MTTGEHRAPAGGRYSEEQREFARTLRGFFATECTTGHVRAAEDTGFDPKLWRHCVDLGLVSLSLPEELGGGGGTLTDAAIAAAEAGRALAPIPLVEVTVGRRLLARAARSRGSHSPRLPDDALVMVVFDPARAGEPLLHAGGAVTEHLVMDDGAGLLVAPVVARTAHPSNLACLPVGTVTTGSGERLTGAGPDALRTALREWRVLQASALTGLARRALEIAVDYARQRVAFGRPIGAFQAMAHRLADLAVLVDGAELLTGEAAAALDEEHRSGGQLAAMAFRHAARTAVATTEYALHVHGGAGFAREYDIQLYFRRAHGWPLSLGRHLRGTESVARELFDEEPGGGAEGGRRDNDTTSYEACREEAREFLAREFTEVMRQRIAEGCERVDRGYHRALMATGWFAAWFRVGESDPGERLVRLQALWDEATAVGAPIDYLAPTLLVGRALQELAGHETRSEIIGGILHGEVQIALGFSEPEAGSDLAAVRTRAVRAGGGWLVTGEKVWTTNADIASHIYLLTRTDPGAAKHRGLTVFLVPIDSPGISVQPIRTLADHPVFQIVFDQVRVPDGCRVGEVDRGWAAMRTTLAFEHGVPRQEFLAPLYQAVMPWTKRIDPVSRTRPADDPQVRSAVADMAIDREIAALMRRRLFQTIVAGATPGPEANIFKLFHAESYTRAAAALLSLQSVAGGLEYGDPDAVLDGTLARAVRTAQMMTIAGGTSEIHRDVIAQRALGLPVDRKS